eukprot:CAMPEP_0168198768 /NCGR_PEP_ID=MMETSP0139_2-20121125/21998_1 /TAXON_ID=44445 /ORGANISM="Pseudo-nitzschia australis, Strain 10249 10 AB" /LENGTH=774 /DNA_ID=CAMNT_0008123577 /DNA_START=294 /DNA_END=2615 /DNA_ORIENTATION=+
MVASSRIVTVTNATGVRSNDDTLIDDMQILTHGGSSPQIIRRLRNSSSKAHKNGSSTKATTDTRMRIQAEIQRPSSSPLNNDGRGASSKIGSGNHIPRVRSDNLAQSKREDPRVRRSIFGHYFQEKDRSYSAPHLVRNQPPLPPPPPPPPPVSDSPSHSQAKEQQSTRRSFRRSSSDFASKNNVNPIDQNGIDHRRQSRHHKHFSRDDLPVDYRVFAPSEHQAATSAICYRYRELNRDHEKEYDSLLERKVRVEHSLPPFPSPLIRFCSETTTTVAGNDSHSFTTKHFNGSNGSDCNYSSHDREIHYHGVYSLLTPISILRPSRYTCSCTSNGNSDNNTTTAVGADSISEDVPGSISGSNETKVPTKLEEEKDQQHLSTSLASSFNFPRSYIETSSIIKTLASASTENVSFSCTDVVEEKKESDIVHVPLNTISVVPVPVASALKPLPFIATDILRGDNVASERLSSGNTTEAINSNCAENTCCDNDPKYEMVSTELQHHQHLRFDPRVTVTEFEDPIPRKWYNADELDQHKREAIAVAQAYLREHRAVADFYRRATLDRVTNTYRKRALYSLPVFSSTYCSSNEADKSPTVAGSPSFRQDKKSEELVRKILIVDPNAAILSLLYKSMKSMFPSAEILIARSAEKALRLVEECIAPIQGATATYFDIIIVDQIITIRNNSKNNTSHGKDDDTCLPGFLNMFMKKVQESPIASVPSKSCDVCYGSDLIEQVCRLSFERKREGFSSAPPQCLLIGVSIRPERDAIIMRRAGADVVW